MKTVDEVDDFFRKLHLGRQIHWRVRNYPDRLVVKKGGLSLCHSCERYFRMWITDDGTWRTLSKKLWKKHLCTKCFRIEVRTITGLRSRTFKTRRLVSR